MRGRGIDTVALAHVRRRHGAARSVFVDGWTGKGAITAELAASLPGTGFAFELATVADPAGCASRGATVDDYVLPSGLLGAIVSGLVSRSVLSPGLVGPDDFHACRFLAEHAAHDVSAAFVDAVEGAAPTIDVGTPWTQRTARLAREELPALLGFVARDAGVDDVNRIKPGIAEATRALLRRVPDALYLADRGDPEVLPLLHLAERAGVPVRTMSSPRYRAVTVIRRLGPEAGSGARSVAGPDA